MSCHSNPVWWENDCWLISSVSYGTNSITFGMFVCHAQGEIAGVKIEVIFEVMIGKRSSNVAVNLDTEK